MPGAWDDGVEIVSDTVSGYARTAGKTADELTAISNAFKTEVGNSISAGKIIAREGGSADLAIRFTSAADADNFLKIITSNDPAVVAARQADVTAGTGAITTINAEKGAKSASDLKGESTTNKPPENDIATGGGARIGYVKRVFKFTKDNWVGLAITALVAYCVIYMMGTNGSSVEINSVTVSHKNRILGGGTIQTVRINYDENSILLQAPVGSASGGPGDKTSFKPCVNDTVDFAIEALLGSQTHKIIDSGKGYVVIAVENGNDFQFLTRLTGCSPTPTSVTLGSGYTPGYTFVPNICTGNSQKPRMTVYTSFGTQLGTWVGDGLESAAAGLENAAAPLTDAAARIAAEAADAAANLLRNAAAAAAAAAADAERRLLAAAAGAAGVVSGAAGAGRRAVKSAFNSTILIILCVFAVVLMVSMSMK